MTIDQVLPCPRFPEVRICIACNLHLIFWLQAHEDVTGLASYVEDFGEYIDGKQPNPERN